MAEWYTVATSPGVDRLRAAWPGAPTENLELCETLLEVAREQVEAFAPALDPDAPLPLRYTYAQLQQAMNLWAAGRADENGNVGTEGFSFQPRPLDKTIRNIIRPTSGVASVL